MGTFFALHTALGDPAKGWEFFSKGAPALAAAMAAGQTPAKCIKTWNPYPYGRGNYVFCVWEAEKAADVEKILRDAGFYDYVTIDLMQVDEIDWAQLALAAK